MKKYLKAVLTVILLFVLIIATEPLWLQFVSNSPSSYITVDSYEDACEKLKQTDDFIPYFTGSQFQSLTYELHMSIFAKARYLNAVHLHAYTDVAAIKFRIYVDDDDKAWQTPNFEYNGIGYYVNSGNEETVLKLGDRCYDINYTFVGNSPDNTAEEINAAVLELKETIIHDLIDSYLEKYPDYNSLEAA